MPPKKSQKGKKSSHHNQDSRVRELILKEDMEDYAKMIKHLGDCRISVVLTDNTQLTAVIPGKFKKRNYINVGDIVLVSKRGYQSDKVDVLHKYTPLEVRKLLKLDEIPMFFTDSDRTQEDDARYFMSEIGDSDDENQPKDEDKQDIDLPNMEEENDDTEDDEDEEEEEIDIDKL